MSNLNDWALAAANNGDKTIAEKFNVPRDEFISLAVKLQLPMYKNITLPMAEFLFDPYNYLSSFTNEKLFYVNLIPDNNTYRRYGTSGLDAEQLLDYIFKCIPLEDFSKYRIRIYEFGENLYGGNIVCKDGSVYTEFHAGKQGGIAKGSVTPTLYAYQDVFTGCFKYSFADIHVREIIYRVISQIPHQGRLFLDGYYEFVMANLSVGLTPIFIDYKAGNEHLLPYRGFVNG